MHLLEQRRGDLETAARILVERGVLDGDRRGIREGLKQAKLVLGQFGAGSHAQAESAERFPRRA